MKKILFLYSGEREGLVKLVNKKEAPDTQLYGMNHIKGDFEISLKDFSSTFLGRIFGKYIGFRLKHFLIYFYSLSADIIFGSSLLYMLPLKKIFGIHGKLILMNTSLNRFLNNISKRKFLFKIIKNLLKEIDFFVSLSNIQLDELRDKYNIPINKSTFIHLGVDIDFHRPRYENRKDYVLVVGNDDGRDYKTVVDTAISMPEIEFHFVTNKRNLSNIIFIPSNVKIFFKINKIDLKNKFEEALVLLVITHRDNFEFGSDCSGQTVFLEGMASGIPIIMTDKSYIRDYIGQNVDDFITLVKAYDSIGIRDIIKDILSNKNKYIDKAKNARKFTEENLSTKIMGDNLSLLFNKI